MNIPSNMKDALRKYFRKKGVDIVSYDPVYHPIARRFRLMSLHKINLVFDVGANTGQYGISLRNMDYRGKIVSFEPLTTAFRQLEDLSRRDPDWKAVNIALGNDDGTAEINVSKNSQSSSILNMLPSHVAISPGSNYVGREKIAIRKLDTIFEDYCSPQDHLYLKIDAQGYEKNIIDSGNNVLNKIVGVQLELSLVPLYEGEVLLEDMIRYMKQRDYILMSVEPTFGNPKTGQLLQLDCLFFRESNLTSSASF